MFYNISYPCLIGWGEPCTIGGEPGHALGDIAFNGAGDGWRNVPLRWV